MSEQRYTFSVGEERDPDRGRMSVIYVTAAIDTYHGVGVARLEGDVEQICANIRAAAAEAGAKLQQSIVDAVSEAQATLDRARHLGLVK